MTNNSRSSNQYYGIKKGEGSLSELYIGHSGGTQKTFVTASGTGGNVDVYNVRNLTASYAQIEVLDVVTLNSKTTTQENLNVSASLIVASDGAGNSSEADGSGLYISGANASFTWDNGNSLMSLNKALKSSAAITAGTSFIIGSADLNETDMEKLDQITDGTVAANKAVVVDGNKDASGFRNVTMAQLSASSTLQAVGAATFGGTLTVTGAISGAAAVQGGAFTGTSLALQSGDITAAGDIDGSGDLTMGTITMTGFSVDADGDTSAKSLSATNGNVSASANVQGGGTLTIAGASTLNSGLTVNGAESTFNDNVSISSGGNLTVADLITGNNGLTINGATAALNAGATTTTLSASSTLQAGAAIFNSTLTVSGAISGAMAVQGGAFTGTSLALQSGGITAAVAIAGATTISGSSTLQMVGAVTFGSTLTVTGAISGAAAVQGGAFTGTSLALQSGGITAAGAIAGATSIDGTGDLTMGSITMAEFAVDSSGNTDIDGTLNVEGVLTHQANLVPSANGTLDLGASGTRYANVYANNMITGDLHMKNERGDWTLFEESDHIRIRNNATCQEFKLDMTPLA